jgi:hypothetical protein
MPLALYPQCPLDKRLGGPQHRSRRCGEEKKYFSLPGIELQYPFHDREIGSNKNLGCTLKGILENKIRNEIVREEIEVVNILEDRIHEKE